MFKLKNTLFSLFITILWNNTASSTLTIFFPLFAKSLIACKHHYCNTLLLESCCDGSYTKAKRALNLGADPDCAFMREGRPIGADTALALALQFDCYAIAKRKQTTFVMSNLLISYGANVNQPILYSPDIGFKSIQVTSTFLLDAVHDLNPKVVQFLLAHGADSNAKNHRGDSVLHLLCYRLASLRKDLSDVDDTIHLPREAYENNKQDALVILNLLIKQSHDWKSNLMTKNSDRDTPLHLAAAAGFTEFAQLLVKKKQNPEAQYKRYPRP